MDKEALQWLSKRFDIPEEDILWYNAGICYSRIGVRSIESAKKVSLAVRGETVNGGILDGMPLGQIAHRFLPSENNAYGEHFDITC